MQTEEDVSAPQDIVNPIVGSALETPESALDALEALRGLARRELDDLCRRLRAGTGHDAEIHEKSRRSALGKATRPSLLAERPWFGVAHLRDFLRFRNSFERIRDAAEILAFFAEEARKGHISFVKFESRKFARPNPYGWRMIATDLRLGSTGMIVEHYMTYRACIEANDSMMHAIYERWRGRSGLTIGERRRQAAEIGLCATANVAIFGASCARGDSPLAGRHVDGLTNAVGDFTATVHRSLDRGFTRL